MTQHIRIYPPPLALRGPPAALQVTGVLPSYKVGSRYDGRLQIINAIGKCRVQIMPDSTMPTETRLSVDNVTHEVVVVIPYLQPVPQPIVAANLSFEDGDSGWLKGPGVRISDTEQKHDGAWSAVYDGKQMGLSEIESDTFVPVTGGQSVSATAWFQQGGGDVGEESGRIVLNWYATDKQRSSYKMPGERDSGFSAGNLVDDGRRGAWHTSNVNANAPEDGFARLGFSFSRRRRHFPCWLDQFSWNATATFIPEPLQPETNYYLHLRVTDGAGRTADWRGYIFEYAILLTSQLYAVEVLESIAATGALINSNHLRQPIDNIISTGTLQSASLNETVSYQSYSHPGGLDEAVFASGSLLISSLITAAMSYKSPGSVLESVNASSSLLGGVLKVVVSYADYSNGKEDSVVASGSLIGATLS